MGTLASTYAPEALPACILALHFSLAVQAGITIEFKVLGISAIKKEWVYTFRRADEAKTAENAMTLVKNKIEPTGELGVTLAKLRKDKKTAEEELHAQKVMRQLFSETGTEVDLVLTTKEKELFKTAFKISPKDKVKYSKWKPLSETIEAKATQLENDVFELQAKINEITIPGLVKLRDDFVTIAAGKAPGDVPAGIKTSFEALTGSAWTAVSSDSERYKLITAKLKVAETAAKAIEKSSDGLEKKLVFFSFCIYEAAVGGAKGVPAFFRTLPPSTDPGKAVDDTFPKIKGGKTALYKNDQAFITGFLAAESRGEAVVEEGAEEDKAEKHGWQIVEKPV